MYSCESGETQNKGSILFAQCQLISCDEEQKRKLARGQKSSAAIGTVWVSKVGVKIKDTIEHDSEKNGGRRGSSAPPICSVFVIW